MVDTQHVVLDSASLLIAFVTFSATFLATVVLILMKLALSVSQFIIPA